MRLSRLALGLFGFYAAAFGAAFGTYSALQHAPWQAVGLFFLLSACGFAMLHLAGRE